LFAFAGVVAANEASRGDAQFDMSRFKVGRADCSSDGQENDPSEHFPGNNMQNLGEVTKFFNDAFGLNEQESVALMGAHSLGRMETKNSGYEGPWVNNIERLDSAYYQEVAERRWFLKVMPESNGQKHQWERRGPTGGPGNREGGNPGAKALLSTDAAIAFNMHLNQESGAFLNNQECSMCGVDNNPPRREPECCEKNSGYNICRDYSANNPQWMNDFAGAFYKMIDSQQTNLSAPVSVTTTDAPTPRPTKAPTPGKKPGKKGKKGKKRQDSFHTKKSHNDAKSNRIRHRIQKLMKELREVSDQVKKMKNY